MADNFQQDSWSMDGNSVADVGDIDRYSDVSISNEDLNHIISLFGENIENIYELNAGEEHMLSEVVYDSKPPMLLQYIAVIKTASPIDKAKLKRNLDFLTKNCENLRAAFVYRDVSKPYKVIRKYSSADVIFSVIGLENDASDEEISKLTEELVSNDLNRSFDLERDCLFRITIASSKDEKKHVILISQPHINTDGISIGLIGNIINELLVSDSKKIGKDLGNTSMYESYAKYLNENTDKKSELRYWDSLMYGFGEVPELPGEQRNAVFYSSNTYSSLIPKPVFGKLNRLQGTLHTTLFSILQSIWAINLAQLSQKNDQCFGAVISGRDAGASGSYTIVGGFASVIPVRVKINEKATVSQLIEGVSEQSSESMKRNHCSTHEICEKMGRTEKLFSNSLDYLNFLAPESDGEVTDNSGIQIVSRKVLINSTDDMGVVIARTNDGLVLLVNYNQFIFSSQAIKLFIGNFLNLVGYIADNGPDVIIAELPKPSETEIKKVESRKKSAESLQKKLFSTQSFFSDVPREKVDMLWKKADVLVFGKGESITVCDSHNNNIVFFIISGAVDLFIKNKDGEMQKYGDSVTSGIVNIAALFGRPATFSTVVKEDNTIAVSVDAELFWKVLLESPVFCKKFFTQFFITIENLIRTLVD